MHNMKIEVTENGDIELVGDFKSPNGQIVLHDFSAIISPGVAHSIAHRLVVAAESAQLVRESIDDLERTALVVEREAVTRELATLAEKQAVCEEKLASYNLAHPVFVVMNSGV